MPYTYYLYHKPTKQHYYGARYAKGCSPEDLWITYFSSSKVVKQLIEQYGVGSFQVSIRKVFETAKQAIAWECKFLSRIDAQHRDDWLNLHNGKKSFIGPHQMSKQTRKRIAQKITGIRRSDETRRKLSEAAKRREERKRVEGWKMPQYAIEKMQTTRQERIAAGEINPYSEKRNKKMGATKRGARRKYLEDGSFIMVKD